MCRGPNFPMVRANAPEPDRVRVGVGIMIAHNPLHGSGQAGFPHPALALGEDAHATQGIGMTEGRHRKPASDEAPHAIPKDAAFLAAPRQRAMPKPPYLEPKEIQRRLVHGHPVVADVSTHHCLQPLAYFGDGFMHPSLKFGFHLVQFRLQSLADRLPQHRKPSIAPLLYAYMRVSRPAEFHHRPLAEPSVRLSPHSAPIRQTGRPYGPSVTRIEVLLFPVASGMRPPDPTPSLQLHYEPSSLVRVGPPQCSASVRSPRGFGRLGFSLRIRATGSCSSAQQPASASRPLYAGRRPHSHQAPRGPFPGGLYAPGFDDTCFLNDASSKGSLSFVSRMLTCTGLFPRFYSNAHHHGLLPQQLGSVWDLLLKADPEGSSLIYCAACDPHGYLVHIELLIRAFLQHTEAKKVERLRFPFSTPLPLVDRIRTKLQKSRFLGMQFQVELPHSFRKFRPKLIGIRFAVKAHHDVVRETHHDDIAVRALLTPCLDPQIEYVMKIDVGQKRRSTSALGRPFLRPYSFPILQHAGSQPFLDEPHDAPVCYPVLDELHKPFVREAIEKAFDVQVEHPVHFSRQQSRVQSIQRLMLAAPWSEPVRKSKKIRFVDGVQHLDRRTLDDLVFQRRDSERSLPPVGLRDKHSTHRLRSVRSSLQPFGKILEVSLQRLAVVPPRLPVHTGSGFLLQSEVGHPQCFQVVDVVQKRREPQLLILSCCLTYPLQRTRRVRPARCPGRVLLWQVPFGQTASLHPLRCQLPGVVRRLLRYYWSVRLPRSVRHRRTSLDFPTRPKATAALGEHGISRFPSEVSAYVHGVSDRAGLCNASRYRRSRWGLPLLLTASASRRKELTRLNTRPARSPVNASTLLLRAAPHDSGPMWVATSHSYDFCIHYTSPVLTGAHGEYNDRRNPCAGRS